MTAIVTKLTDYLYPYRFELFLVSLFSILFGSLFVPSTWFESVISPVLLIINLMAGVVLTSKNKRAMRFLLALLVLNVIIFANSSLHINEAKEIEAVKLFSYFIFYGMVTYEIVDQVAKATSVTLKVINGIICGYLSLGLLAFFLFFAIEYFVPNSYSNIVFNGSGSEMAQDKLMYFSYVTLLTIGYGEIVPLSGAAQKGSVLVALLGQFYIVILTAIVVGKFINQSNSN